MVAPNRPRSQTQEIRELTRRVEALARSVLLVPVLAADPTSPIDGQVWIRRDTLQLCWRVAGTTRRVTGA